MVRKKTSKMKKRWLQILAPKFLNSAVLGETHIYEPEEVIGKKLTTNLMTITRDMKKQNYNVTFQVDEIKGEKASSKLVGYRMIPASMKRLLRRNKDKIDESFVVASKDGLNARVKLLLVTLNKTSRAVKTDIRKLAKQEVAAYFKRLNFEAFMQDVINIRFQRTIKSKLTKIYPIRTCELRSINITEGKNVVPIKVEIKEEKAKEETAEAKPEKTREEQSSSVSQKSEVSVKPEEKKEEAKPEKEKPAEEAPKEEVKSEK